MFCVSPKTEHAAYRPIRQQIKLKIDTTAAHQVLQSSYMWLQKIEMVKPILEGLKTLHTLSKHLILIHSRCEYKPAIIELPFDAVEKEDRQDQQVHQAAWEASH